MDIDYAAIRRHLWKIKILHLVKVYSIDIQKYVTWSCLQTYYFFEDPTKSMDTALLIGVVCVVLAVIVIAYKVYYTPKSPNKTTEGATDVPATSTAGKAVTASASAAPAVTQDQVEAAQAKFDQEFEKQSAEKKLDDYARQVDNERELKNNEQMSAAQIRGWTLMGDDARTAKKMLAYRPSNAAILNGSGDGTLSSGEAINVSADDSFMEDFYTMDLDTVTKGTREELEKKAAEEMSFGGDPTENELADKLDSARKIALQKGAIRM